RNPLALIALQHQRAALDRAAAAEGVLEGLEPDEQLGWFEIELLDHGDFLAPATLALEAHHCAGGTFRRRGVLFGRSRLLRQISELAAQCLEGIVERFLLVAHARSQI